MTLEQLIRDLTNSNLGGENEWYRWKEISDADLPRDVFLPAGNQYAKNVALKCELHRLWSDTNSDIAEYVALAKYYVSTWGGIRSNKDETLRKYVTQEPDSIIRNGKKGIASWSKVLCIRGPNRYAIFDARFNCIELPSDHRPHRTPIVIPFTSGTEQKRSMLAG
jgi:hypothetical protein